MKKAVIKFIVPFILLILSVLFVYILTGGMIRNIVISAETLFMPFLSCFPINQNTDYFVKMFLSSDHSWFLVSFVTHLLSRVLPVFTDIHPQEFYLSYGWIIFFFIFYIQSSILTFNVAKYFKYRFAYLYLFFVMFPFLFSNLQSSEFMWVLFNDTWFFCYIFNSIFQLLLFVILEKNYVTTGEIIRPPPAKSKLNIYLLSVLTLILITGIGHELYRFVLCGTFILGLIFHKIVFKTHFKTNKIWYFLSYLLIMSCFLFLTTAWNNWSKILLNESEPLCSFAPMFEYFCEYVVMDNILKILFILLFSVLSFIISDNRNSAKRLMIVTFSGLISVILFNLIIILICGKHFEISQHNGIVYLTRTIFSYLLFSNLGFLFVYSSEKYKTAIEIFIALFFTFWILFFYQGGLFNTKVQNLVAEQCRVNQYMIEKAYDVFGKTHNVIYATYPDASVDKHSIYYLKYWYGGNDKDYKIKYVCKKSDSFEKCQKKFINLLHKKSGCLMTKKELMETNFSDIDGYNKQKSNGKIYVDFFND